MHEWNKLIGFLKKYDFFKSVEENKADYGNSYNLIYLTKRDISKNYTHYIKHLNSSPKYDSSFSFYAPAVPFYFTWMKYMTGSNLTTLVSNILFKVKTDHVRINNVPTKVVIGFHTSDLENLDASMALGTENDYDVWLMSHTDLKGISLASAFLDEGHLQIIDYIQDNGSFVKNYKDK